MLKDNPWVGDRTINDVRDHYGLPPLPADPDFEIGDVVSLIVGGPDMVIIGLCECGTVEVAWADSEGDVCVDVFPEEALYHVV